MVSGSFQTLLSYSIFGAWVFYGLSVAAVVVLQRTQPDRPRPYRMWGYPATPLLFSAITLGLVANSAVTRPGPSLAGLLLMAAGIPFYYWWRGTKHG
ncbi:MAG: hypothetical protein HY238_07980 [Acidobacteria bacterium]|nr:hypothetical protein [Acidobacteriota bacterium]